MAKTVFHPANQRGHADHGWLKAYHSFSFAGWYDPSKIHFGALRVLNDDTVSAGMGFGKHPHDNMEIITIVTEGTLAHKDSMGHAETIEEGEVQVMSAGTGVFHSEFNHSEVNPVKLFQSWIFPSERNVKPRYEQARFDEADRDNRLQLLVSPIGTDDPGLKIHQHAWIYRTNLTAGESLEHKLHSTENGVYIFVVDGQIEVEGQKLGRRDALGISDTSAVSLAALTNADVLLYEVPMTA